MNAVKRTEHWAVDDARCVQPGLNGSDRAGLLGRAIGNAGAEAFGGAGRDYECARARLGSPGCHARRPFDGVTDDAQDSAGVELANKEFGAVWTRL
jgi:hypothetical protein